MEHVEGAGEGNHLTWINSLKVLLLSQSQERFVIMKESLLELFQQYAF